jgi:L-lactate dehydrogenase complex protein LldG
MQSRERILNEIKLAKPSTAAIDISVVNGIKYPNLTQQFVKILTAIGGKAKEFVNETTALDYLNNEVFSGENEIVVLANEKLQTSIIDLYNVDIALIRGGVAVAENGAIWVPEKNMGNRVLPFSCKQLIIIIEEKHIVHNMHEAYELINIEDDGYGVFIAGPSKTADIEQSLVIGAHGPINFLAIIINE